MSDDFERRKNRIRASSIDDVTIDLKKSNPYDYSTYAQVSKAAGVDQPSVIAEALIRYKERGETWLDKY